MLPGDYDHLNIKNNGISNDEINNISLDLYQIPIAMQLFVISLWIINKCDFKILLSG